MSNGLRTMAVTALAAGALALSAPSQAMAQGRSQGHGKAQTQSKQHGKSQSKSQVRVANGGKNGKGPAFCRSGAGHPVFGRSWCVEKGFGLGSSQWGNADWGSVVFGRGSSRTGSVGSGTLRDVLGRIIYGRLQNQYGSGALTGNWISSTSGPLLLQVQSGSRPVAEFVDRNRDGRADAVFLNLSH
jgi:hypothetical protein